MLMLVVFVLSFRSAVSCNTIISVRNTKIGIAVLNEGNSMDGVLTDITEIMFIHYWEECGLFSRRLYMSK